MSNWTDIILTVEIYGEDIPEGTESKLVDQLNAWLISKHDSKLVQVNQAAHAQGARWMQSSVYIGAVNWLKRVDLIEAFNAIKWPEDEKILLLLKSEEDEQFVGFAPEPERVVEPESCVLITCPGCGYQLQTLRLYYANWVAAGPGSPHTHKPCHGCGQLIDLWNVANVQPCDDLPLPRAYVSTAFQHD